MPDQPDRDITHLAKSRTLRRRTSQPDHAVVPIHDDRAIRELDVSGMRVHITTRPTEGETVCAVEGAIDASSAEHLADALRVALDLEPRNSLLLDLSEVNWMALLEVYDVIEEARARHVRRRIKVRHTSAGLDDPAGLQAEAADGSGPAPKESRLAGRSGSWMSDSAVG
jgi:hypothetical protein